MMTVKLGAHRAAFWIWSFGLGKSESSQTNQQESAAVEEGGSEEKSTREVS